MDDKEKKQHSTEKKASDEGKQVLLEAEIVARWAKKPFYIS